MDSLTQAAAELNVSHSAVSQQLRLLEGYFSCKLVRKTGNRIELTPAARSYAHEVRKSLDLLAVASEDFASSGSASCRTAPWNSFSSITHHWLWVLRPIQPLSAQSQKCFEQFITWLAQED
ncbi:LysR family transcriptional regulator [Bradyrhizobium australiense]|uniref:LysR family transcriptional regulator n=1 Tax=Bradyrhizobium australiense TaxID=2721161 RepID=A0A7Y4GSD7_9BRAD|nr:LysR family transcriptional regulator [Bradyrhizobium australiense]